MCGPGCPIAPNGRMDASLPSTSAATSGLVSSSQAIGSPVPPSSAASAGSNSGLRTRRHLRGERRELGLGLLVPAEKHPAPAVALLLGRRLGAAIDRNG